MVRASSSTFSEMTKPNRAECANPHVPFVVLGTVCPEFRQVYQGGPLLLNCNLLGWPSIKTQLHSSGLERVARFHPPGVTLSLQARARQSANRDGLGA